MIRPDPPFPAPLAVLVNDDAMALNLQARLLTRAGLEVRTYGGAEQALSAMDPARPPSLIVTDLYMPGIDGWRFCRLLRSPEFPAFNAVPILVVSATYAGDEPDRIAADLGAEAFLPSPVEGPVFVDHVRAILEGRTVRTLPGVLIVEDSRTLAGMLKKLFTDNGYRADTASTVLEARAAFAVNDYAVAVLDYHLPDGTGDALLDAFHTQRPGCVCMMMTTDPEPHLAMDWMKRGAADYLRKPFQGEFLLERCARARRERALLRVQDMLEVRTRELRVSEEKFRLIAENTSDGIIAMAPGGRIRYASPSLARQLGYPQEEILAADRETFYEAVHPEDREPLHTLVHGAVEHRLGELKYWYRIRHKDGHYLWREDHAKFTYDGTGRHLATYVVCTDITQRKQAEAEGAALQTQLLQSQKLESVGRLAGGVAHDFNNMLTVIIGLSDLLLTQMEPEGKAIDRVREIHRAAERSAQLTRQLLAFARRQTIVPQVLDLNDTVAEMLTMLRRLIGEDLQITWAPGGDLWQVRMDPSQLDQILANLCVNSRDAIAGHGTVTIETGNVTLDPATCAAHPEVDPGDYVLLAVTDDGEGMDEATRKLIFEPFFTTKEAGKGTGLGLAMVYGIVKQNKGLIQVLSEPGRGATFRIYLPREQGRNEQLRADGTPRTATGRETILVVEDEPAILDMAATLLGELGYTVLAAPDAEEALRLARTGAVDLLLADLILPGMNGLELARALRAFHPRVRTLFMSGYGGELLEDQPVLAEGARFLQKPFSLKALAERVREALD